MLCLSGPGARAAQFAHVAPRARHHAQRCERFHSRARVTQCSLIECRPGEHWRLQHFDAVLERPGSVSCNASAISPDSVSDTCFPAVTLPAISPSFSSLARWRPFSARACCSRWYMQLAGARATSLSCHRPPIRVSELPSSAFNVCAVRCAMGRAARAAVLGVLERARHDLHHTRLGKMALHVYLVSAPTILRLCSDGE